MKEKNAWQTSSKERVLYYSLSFGQIIFYTIAASYLQLFMTDIGISAATVGTIFLIARAWDAVNDPLFGVIVSKSRLKGGKYKPWLKLAPILIFIFTVLLFGLPSGLSASVKTLLAATLYICWGMSYTMCDIPYFSVISTISDQVSERGGILTRARLFTMVGAVLVTLTLPNLYPRWGWFATVGLLAVIGLGCMLPFGFAVKERHSSFGKAPALKDIMMAVVKNKYLLALCTAVFIANVTNTTSTIASYFAIHCLGGSHMISVITTIPLLSFVVIVAFVPAIIKRVDKYYIYLACFVTAFVASLAIFFIGYSNIVLFVVLSCVRTSALTFIQTFIALYIVDCAEYGRFKTGEDITPVSVSLQTFTVKAISTMSASLGMFVLGIVGFVDGAGAVQPDIVTDTLFFLISIVPGIGVVIGFFIFLRNYKLRDNYVQVMAQVNNGEISREEGEKLLPPSL